MRNPCASRRRTAAIWSVRTHTTSRICLARPRSVQARDRRSRASSRSLRSSSMSVKPGFTTGLSELAHAQNITLTLGYRDHAARVEQIEHVACLDALIVSRQRHQVPALVTVGPTGVEIFPARLLGHAELLKQHW